jgi:hypothetical protein
MMRSIHSARILIVFLLIATLLPRSQPTGSQNPERWVVASNDGTGATVYAKVKKTSRVVATFPDGTEVSVHSTPRSKAKKWRLVEGPTGIQGYVLLAELRPTSNAISRQPDSETRGGTTPITTPTSRPAPSPQTPQPGSDDGRQLERFTGGRPGPTDKHPKLDSQLAALSRILQERGPGVARDEARTRGLTTSDTRVRVVIEAAPNARASVAAGAASLGSTTEAEYANLVQAMVPIQALAPLAGRADVIRIAPPAIPVPLTVTGEEVVATGANAWHAAAINGTGVKVAVIDLGFGGLAARQAAGDLPVGVVTQDFCSGSFNGPEVHGVGVAEIVYEMAPGAQLYLLCVGTQVQLGQAKDYAKAQGVHIINHSVGWFNTSRGDGSGGAGTPDGIVEDARNNGILWVNSAGNSAQRHWTGTFSSADGDEFHNFTAVDEGNTIQISSGAQACVRLKWDSWPTTAQDYDLYLVRTSDGVFVQESENFQTGTQPPTEAFCYVNPFATQSFEVAIGQFQATQTPRFDLFTSGGSTLQYQTAAGSLLEPATAPEAFAVGAICWQNNALESFSSRGPTIDGRIKPDIAGQDAMSSGTYGTFTGCGNGSGFTGTSASSPTVAGAAALVKQANPSFTPAQLQSFLEGRAIDQGAGGKDNEFGSGRLALGTPPSPCPSPRPDLPRSLTPVGSGRLQVTVTAGHGSLTSVTATKLTNVQVELPGGTLTANGQSLALSGSSVNFFVQRTGPSGAYTAELSFSDGCGPYPLFFGAGS